MIREATVKALLYGEIVTVNILTPTLLSLVEQSKETDPKVVV